MEEDNFNADWLNERYPYDSEARDKTIEDTALNYLKAKTNLHLVDVGAGTGSNALYLMDKLEQDQSWTFIETDTALNSILIRRLKEFALYHKYGWEVQKGKYIISTPAKTLSFQILNNSLLDIASLVDLSSVDLVLANAVFDLLPATQIETFLQPILKEKGACLFTMNYQQMVFTPSDPFDDNYIALYNKHLERPQDFGQAMGKQAGNKLIQLFKEANWVTHQAESFWQLLADDIKMHYYLLNFMDKALQELDFEKPLKEQFPKWLQRKKELIITRRQQLTVGHLDIFATA